MAGAPARPDPNSPAGVEYELPLEGARRDAAGPDRDAGTRKSAKDASGDRAAPLFGQGITKAVGSSAGGTSGKGGGSGGAGGSRAAEPARTAEPTQSVRLAADASAGGKSTTLVLGGVAAAVLLAGGLIGFSLRRGLGRSGPS